MKPRILQLISTQDNTVAENQFCLLTKGISRDQFNVHACVLCSGATAGLSSSAWRQGAMATLAWPCNAAHTQPNFIDGIFQTTFIKSRWKYDAKTYWTLKQIIDRFQPDILHAWTSMANLYGLAAAKAFGIKHLVAGYYNIDPYTTGMRLTIDRYISKHSVHMTTDNAGVRDFYVQKGLPTEKFRVIGSGVGAATPSSTTRRQLVAEFGLKENSRLIGLVGNLLLRDRIKDAIWAADLLKVIRKDVHLLIIGDGPHRDRLRRFRDNVRIADFVHFLGPRNDLNRLLPHFDLLWSTSPYNNQSDSILQAMAAGVPVVAAENPCTRNLVIHQQTGFLAPLGDRAVFARHAHQLIEDPALAQRLGQAARERTERDFSTDNMIRQYLEIYRQILG
jgi:glycosyltransferase involved in cell wall biosynthesis